MVSKNKIIKFTVLISIVSVSLTSLVLTLESKADLTQYMVEDSKVTNQIQVDDLLLKIDGLEQTISELKAQINSIPIDDTLKFKNQVYDWIDIFYKNQANRIDRNSLDEIMYIPADDTEFYSQDNLEKTAIMFTTVLHQDEGLDIKVINKSNNRYRISTLDGSSFDIKFHEDLKISSPWTMAYKTDHYMQAFVRELKAKNKDILYQYITYEAYDWSPEDFESAYEKHLGKVSKFNLDSIGYSFVGITQFGFKYEIYDRQTQEKEYFDVNTDDGILLINKSNSD